MPLIAWQSLAHRDVHRDRWLTVCADRCRLPNGREIAPYDVLEESPWVNVVARDAIFDGEFPQAMHLGLLLAALAFDKRR